MNKIQFQDVLEPILKNAIQYPNQLAVVENERECTYQNLISLAYRMAYHFRNSAQHPKVLINLTQSTEAYAAMIGALLAGGFYCPSNMSAPKEKQRLVIEQFKPDIIVGNDEPIHSSGQKFNFLKLEAIGNKVLEEEIEPHDLAYVIFTSGSTGIPKGVMVSRESLAHYISWAVREMHISERDRWSQHPNIGFDLSILDIFGALCGGATLYPMANKRDRLMIAEFIQRNKLTIWNSVPSVIDLMVRSKSFNSDNLASLRLFTFCGEPLLEKHLDTIFSVCPNVEVHNTYGPTEATVSFTLLRLNKSNYKAACGEQSVAIGEAINGMNLSLVGGEKLNEGEIIVSGPQVARGYWRDPQRTKAAFDNVEINDEKTWAYRTGDYGYYKDGHYFFGSRIDRQVKINGFRLELGEVDAAFRLAGVNSVCTILYKTQLFTFIEAAASPNMVKIRSDIAQILPPYAIPTEIFLIDEIPRNTNDKIDNLALENQVKKLLNE